MHTIVVILKGHPQAVTLFYKDGERAAADNTALNAPPTEHCESVKATDDFGNVLTAYTGDVSATLLTDVDKKHDADIEMTISGYLAQDKMNARAASDPKILAAQRMAGLRQGVNGGQPGFRA